LSKAIQLLRTAFLFAVNFCAAALVTNYFSNELSHVFPPKTSAGLLHREYIIGALIALALGYFVFYKWRSAPAKWVWIAGVLWFAREAVPLLSAGPYSVLAAQASFMAKVQVLFDPVNNPSLFVYVFVLERTIFYSAGAWICWSESQYGFSLLAALKKRLPASGAGAV
jgi:hypothetical protein